MFSFISSRTQQVLPTRSMRLVSLPPPRVGMRPTGQLRSASPLLQAFMTPSPLYHVYDLHAPVCRWQPCVWCVVRLSWTLPVPWCPASPSKCLRHCDWKPLGNNTPELIKFNNSFFTWNIFFQINLSIWKMSNMGILPSEKSTFPGHCWPFAGMWCVQSKKKSEKK